jgi:hypothetical protein
LPAAINHCRILDEALIGDHFETTNSGMACWGSSLRQISNAALLENAGIVNSDYQMQNPRVNPRVSVFLLGL